MPKINREEYEVLKELDDEWKYLARNNMYGAKLEAHTSRPYKMTDSHWSNGDMRLELLGGEHLFQFIQWEDEEPYNIQELIDEYEIKELRLAPSGTVIVDSFDESEETEVKNIEWLKDEILTDMRYLEGNREIRQLDIKYQTLREVAQKINSLDEPEVLSQEWLDENKSSWTKLKIDGYYIPVEKLQNLLVLKQEKVKVPRFVADILEENTFADLPTAFEELFSANAGHYYGEDVCKWIVSNDETFARAWLDGYTVEEEPKYVIKISEHDYMVMDDEGVMYPTDINVHKYKLEFTEQEIKDYDERYWPFAVKVEELEEC